MLNTTKDSFKLQPLREFYLSGETRTYAFRKKQLEKLKQAVLDHEDEINKALYTDLKKNQEETWATETGLLLMEINIMLRKRLPITGCNVRRLSDVIKMEDSF